MLLDFFFFLLYFAYLFESGISFRQLLIYYLFRNENGMEEGTRKKKRLEFHLPVELHRNRSLNLLKIRCMVFFFLHDHSTRSKKRLIENHEAKV